MAQRVHRAPTWLALAAIGSLIACGGADSEVAATVELASSFDSGDVDGDGTYQQRVGAGALPADAWNDLMARARSSFGADPTAIEVVEARVAVGAGSEITELGGIFDGPLSVRFDIDGGSEYAVGEGLVADGDPATAVNLALRFDFSRLTAGDAAALFDGAFDVLFVGQTGDGVRRTNDRAEVIITLGLRALE